MNISSLIVIPAPGQSEEVKVRLGGIAGVEISATSPEGKMIVILEAESDQETVRLFELISQLDGVMSASLVYHQEETRPDEKLIVVGQA